MKIFKTIVYILSLAVLIYMAVFFNSYYLLIAAFIVIFMAVLDIFAFIIPFGGVNVEIGSDKTDFVKGEKGEIYIKLRSNRALPVYKVRFNITIKNRFYSAETIKIETPSAMFGSKIIVLPLDTVKSGVINISVDELRCSDMFGILERNYKKNVSYSVIVMPKIINVREVIFGYAASDEIPAANVFLSNNGDVSGYSEYGAGDRNNNINWKLFARTEKLYVKEFERTSADEAVVLMDMNIKNLDKAIDIVYSLDYKGTGFTLLWLPGGNEEFESEFISDESSLNNAVYKIYYSMPESVENRGLFEYKRLYRENKVLYVHDKMELL